MRKVDMIPVPLRPPQARRTAMHGFLLVVVGTASVVAGEAATGEAAAQDRGGNRCALYGADVADLGNGTCARVIREAGSQHVRVDLGSRAVSGDPRAWSAAGTANAALRSDGLGMLPGAAEAGHLRVRSGTYGR